jgi:porin
VGELWHLVNQGDNATGLPGTYKLGARYDSGNFSDRLYDNTGQSLASPTSTGQPQRHSGNYTRRLKD